MILFLLLYIRCIQHTHGRTHRNFSLDVQQVYEINREGEETAFKDVGNRQLLWHGSRLTNWVGILSQGLRIAPPEAPVTGYMVISVGVVRTHLFNWIYFLVW